MTGGELTAAQIRALLHELGRRLQAAGAHGDVSAVPDDERHQVPAHSRIAEG